MLQDFNRFIYDLETIYLKELNTNIILNYIENFYKDFIKNNNKIDNILLKKTVEAIIICTDDIILQKSALKNDWIRKTGENYIFHTNRGGEIINNIVNDILSSRIINEETISIISICFTLGARSDYKNKFIDFMKNKKKFYNLNLYENIEKSLLENNNNIEINYLYIFIILFFIVYLLTEINYIFNIFGFNKDISFILNEIRSIYELK